MVDFSHFRIFATRTWIVEKVFAPSARDVRTFSSAGTEPATRKMPVAVAKARNAGVAKGAMAFQNGQGKSGDGAPAGGSNRLFLWKRCFSRFCSVLDDIKVGLRTESGFRKVWVYLVFLKGKPHLDMKPSWVGFPPTCLCRRESWAGWQLALKHNPNDEKIAKLIGFPWQFLSSRSSSSNWLPISQRIKGIWIALAP